MLTIRPFRSLLALAAVAFAPVAWAQNPQLVGAFPNLTFNSPVDLQAPDDGSNRLFVVEQGGRIRVVVNDPASALAPVFLDISGRLVSGGELGLLGLVFDPQYAQNGYFYVNYTASGPLRSVISRFRVSSGNANVGDPNSETILLQVNQPFENHNAGQLQFGPAEGPGGERYLYVPLGDGGSGGDPFGNGQNLGVLLGKMLRLDVNGGGLPLDCAAGTGSGTIPAGNPFVLQAGVCNEIYAYGFRNPFRFSFGPDDRLWLADVGQDEWEEVNVFEGPGGNYGWDRLEGTHCYPPNASCSPAGTVLPIHEYRHTFNANGGFSVTGGYVYAGSNCADIRDRYVYGDYVTGNVWTLDYDGTTATNATLLPLTGKLISTFGLDEQGELYLADLGPDRVFRLDCQSAVTVAADPVGTVVIPAGGGAFEFDVTLRNTTGQRQAFDAWADADLSNGTEVRPVIGPRALSIAPNGTLTSRVRVAVPASAPSGTSTLTVKVGDFPDGPTDSDRFTIVKQSGGNEGLAASVAAGGSGWEAAGWTEAEASEASAFAAASAAAAVDGLAEASPNPFSAATTLRFTLARPGRARLSVYDVLGREVARLVDGVLAAGAHTAVFDGGALPSGAYVVRLRTGAAEAARRVTLVR